MISFQHNPLRKVMQAYCERQGLQLSWVRFQFDGNPVNGTHTPEVLNMEDGDTIDVHLSQPTLRVDDNADNIDNQPGPSGLNSKSKKK